ncbi:hypothetical protein ACRS3X_07915 [Ectopseudomonas hydrolytica]|uniref:hypothetical protein n=1 Tax=Ectopseudomonas hydrolytica TaxID=2493633 RepID=UPI003EE03BE6
MTSSAATTSPSSLARSARRVLILTAFGLFGSFIGFSYGWDAARHAEPVRVSFECEPPAVI